MTPHAESDAVMFGTEPDPESLRSVAGDGAVSVVAVLTRTPPREWLAGWDLDATPHVVDLTGESGASLRLPPDDGRILAGLDRTDLTGVSITVSEFAREATGPVVVYFQSLSTLLLCAGLHRTAAFLQSVKRTIARTDGRVVADFDPDAHDGRTLRLLGTLFDTPDTEAAPGHTVGP